MTTSSHSVIFASMTDAAYGSTFDFEVDDLAEALEVLRDEMEMIIDDIYSRSHDGIDTTGLARKAEKLLKRVLAEDSELFENPAKPYTFSVDDGRGGTQVTIRKTLPRRLRALSS